MAETLWTALLKTQRNLPELDTDGVNPAFRGSKYVKLNAALPKLRGVLNDNGLIVTQAPTLEGLRTTIIHAATGEQLESVMDMKIAKNDPQGQGSAITYARRYALLSILGIVGDEDDDGNNGSLQDGAEERPTAPATPAKSATARTPLPSGSSPTPDRGAHASAAQEKLVTDLVAKIKKRDADHPLVKWYAEQPPVSEWAISRVGTSIVRLKGALAKLENAPELPPDNGDLMVEKVKADFDAEEIPFHHLPDMGREFGQEHLHHG